MIFGITLYGLAAVAVLLALYASSSSAARPPTWALAVFVGSAAAFILPAHIVIAVLALVGVGSVWAIRIGQSLLATRRLPDRAARLAADARRDRRRRRGHRRLGAR